MTQFAKLSGLIIILLALDTIFLSMTDIPNFVFLLHILIALLIIGVLYLLNTNSKLRK